MGSFVGLNKKKIIEIFFLNNISKSFDYYLKLSLLILSQKIKFIFKLKIKANKKYLISKVSC